MDLIETLVEQRRWFVLADVALIQLFFVVLGLLTRLRTGRPVRGGNPEATRAILCYAATIVAALGALFVPGLSRFLLTLEHAHPGLVLSGLALLLLGLVTGVVGSFSMGRSWRVGIVEGQETDLVSRGLFRFIRNPYFLSYLLMFAGFLSIVPGLVLGILCVLSGVVTHRMILAEERFLEGQHGDAYREYRQRTWRYLPPF